MSSKNYKISLLFFLFFILLILSKDKLFCFLNQTSTCEVEVLGERLLFGMEYDAVVCGFFVHEFVLDGSFQTICEAERGVNPVA